VAGAGEDNMGGAAALIPGIVGIAGGEYAGYKKRQDEAADKADMGQFAKSLLESQQGPDPRLGGDVPNPMMSANQLRARAAQRFPSYGEAIIKQDLEMRGKPAKYVIYYDQANGTRRPVPEGTPPNPNEIPIGESDALPKTDKPSDFQLGFADWQKLNPGGTILQYRTAEAAATRAPTAPLSTFDDESKLRSEFDRKTQDFTIVRDAYSNISIVASDASPAGDLSLIFSYMKLLDPTSSVKEGEYATAQNAASVPETVRAKFNKALKGETLTPSQRADFVKQSGNIYESKRKSFESESLRYTDLAKQYKLDPNKIVYDRTNGIVKVIAKIPPVGFKQNGYIFKGGDPSKETDWIAE